MSSDAPAARIALSFSSRIVRRRSISSRSGGAGESSTPVISASFPRICDTCPVSSGCAVSSFFRGAIHSLNVAREKCAHLFAGNMFPFTLGPGGRGARAGPGGRSLQLLGGVEHSIHAIRQALQRPARGPPRALVAVKCGVNPPQNRFDGDARLLPGFYDGPIERRDQQVRPALSPEVLFDLREIIKVIERVHRVGGNAALRANCASFARAWLQRCRRAEPAPVLPLQRAAS